MTDNYLQNISAALPDEVEFSWDGPGTGFGEPTYLDINIASGNSLDGQYDAWCIDTDRSIIGATKGKVFSSYEELPPELIGPGNIEKPENLDSLNWIINQGFVGTELSDENGNSLGTVTYGDVQRAIWSILDDENITLGLGNYSEERAQRIANLALTDGDGFIPKFGDKLAVIIAPDSTDDGVLNPDNQIIIAEVELAKLGNFVFEDSNANGIQDEGEAGIAGVTVNLLSDIDGDGEIEAGEVIDTTTTNENGEYHFTVLAGDYKVQFEQPEGFSEVSPSQQGDDPALDSDGLISDVVTLDPGEYDPTIDAGFYNNLGTIGDRVWADNDGDGVQDDDEAGINGVTVKLINKDTGEVVATDVTSGDGQYLFENLAQGNYTVMVDTDTITGNVQQTGDPDASLDNMSMVDLPAGGNDLHQDFGYQPLGTIGDRVWADNDGDGVQDDDEAGINGVTVKLINKDTGEVVATDVTSGDGQYLFENLAQGNYTVMVDADTITGNVQQTGDPDASLDNMSMVDLPAGGTDLDQDFGYQTLNPGIDIEKLTNGVDADTPESAAEITSGDTVTWTYEITNTGNVSFAKNDIVVTDDQEGIITNITHQGDGDNILAPGETWIYQETGTAQNLTSSGETETFYFRGYSGLDGANGNIRTFTAGDVSVKTSAFSRTNHGVWDKAFLGSFSNGLGVTDNSEGNGGNGLHRVDNVYRDNFVLFEFSESVIVDRTFLASVGADSDITYWVGTVDDSFNNHNILSDSFLNSLEFKEDNNTHSSYARWADINNNEVAGNVLVIAASTSDETPEDRFKIKKLEVQQVENGIYQNVGTVYAPGAEDSDTSHYVNLADNGQQINATLIGNTSIHEGYSSFYKVQLDHAVSQDTVFTIDVTDGTAQRVDRNDYQAANQDIIWGGYYDIRSGVGGQLLEIVDDRVPNGTQSSSGDRPQVGPDGDTIWDYTVEQDGVVQTGGTVHVLVRAGETMSDHFEVQTWKEKVTVDQDSDFTRHNPNFVEGTEDFSIKISGTSGNNHDIIHTGSEKTVNILDKTEYDYVSPIAFDLNGDGVQTESIDKGVKFDILNTGKKVNTGWLSGEDGFLAIDKNKNGQIDDRSELFGGTSVGEGFAKLESFDSNSDGIVNAQDALFNELKLWQDANQNGITDNGELVSLGSAGITDLLTSYTNVFSTDAQGNIHGEHSTAMMNGQAIDMVDVYFKVAV